MGILINVLVQVLVLNVHCNFLVVFLLCENDCWIVVIVVGVIELVDCVILVILVYCVVVFLVPLDKVLSELFNSILYVFVVVVVFGFYWDVVQYLLDGFGFLIFH